MTAHDTKTSLEHQALRLALLEAKRFRGATAPNPPVGAAALSDSGELLAVAAHQRAGDFHAEARLLRECAERGIANQIHTVVVTLEPCNHHGRTPPCTVALIQAGVKRVLFGVTDSNPHVRGGGVTHLRESGIEVEQVRDQDLASECEELVAPFFYWARTGLPWVTVKTAFDSFGSMIPPTGEKTFTSSESLRFAHELRRRSDAILTGSGTVLSDDPQFTVRNVEDHSDKRRWLVVLDRRERVSSDWVEARSNDFNVLRETREDGIKKTLKELGERGVQEILVEAGPQISSAFLEHGLWNEHFMIRAGATDQIERRLRN
jgi:diaminohydroxyphosphoribosylaminopyrimidine deaminase/5-amino-6-(5-phosphoribosylamino)uracil reductase